MKLCARLPIAPCVAAAAADLWRRWSPPADDSLVVPIGVNQRDLVTLQVDHERAVRMGSVIPSHVVRVAESGVRGRDDAQSLRDAGYDAVLVGESLVTATNPTELLQLLRCT